MKNLFFCLLLFLCFQGQAQNLKTTIDNTILDQGNRGITAIKLRNNLHLIVDSLRLKTQLPVNNNTERSYLVEDYGITAGNRNGQPPTISRLKSWITASQLKSDLNAKPTIGYFQNVDPLNPNFYSGYDYVYSTSEKLLYKFVAGSGFLQDRVDQVAENIITESGAIDKLVQKQINSKQDGLSGTGFVKSTAGAISYDNSTYLSTSTAASTYLPINNPTATGTLTSPLIANTLGANFATTSGNVGIGTESPSYKLDLNGTARVTGTTQLNGNVGIGAVPSTQSLNVFSNTNDIAFQAANAKTTGSNYAVAGTATGAGATLNMGGYFYADGATTNHGIRVYNITAAANNYALFIDSPAKSYFQGSVGIGTTSPSSTFHTIGTIQTSSTSSASSNYANRYNNIIFSRFDIPTTYTNVISNSWSGTTTDQTMNFEIGNGSSTRVTAMTLLGNGNVGIGTTAPSYKLDVSGTAQATQFKLSALNTAPASATAAGTLGEIRVDASYIYICTATNTWKRSAITSW